MDGHSTLTDAPALPAMLARRLKNLADSPSLGQSLCSRREIARIVASRSPLRGIMRTDRSFVATGTSSLAFPFTGRCRRRGPVRTVAGASKTEASEPALVDRPLLAREREDDTSPASLSAPEGEIRLQTTCSHSM